MAFPVSPTNGQITVVNQVSYQYSSATNSWTRILSTANVITANTIAVNGALTVGTTISAVGNITGNYFFGNGSQLTGVAAATAGFPVSAGNSNIAAAANSNIAITVSGTPNVAVFATTGEYITGVLSASGTITGGNLATGGTSSAAGNVTGGNLLTGGLVSAAGTVTGTSFLGAVVSVTANVTGGNVNTGGLVSAAGNIYGANLIVSGIESVTGNIAGGNLLTGGLISATGGITSAANVTGGNLLTGGLISAAATVTGGNLATGGTASATGNITGGNVLTGGLISATSTITSAANVIGGNITTAGQVSATANVTGGNILTAGVVSATGNATFGNITTSGSSGNISGANVISGTTLSASGNVIGGNVTTAGVVSATGNVQGNYILGNGYFLTGVITSVANINNGTSNVNIASANANVTVSVNGTSNVAVFATTGEYITGVLSASGNVTGGNVLTGGLVSATATITGGNLATGGTASAAGNVTGGNLYTTGLASVTGNISGGNVFSNGKISATSDISAGGATTVIGVLGVSTGGNATITGYASATGNVIGGNIFTGGLISATGNITGGNVNTPVLNATSGSLLVGTSSGNVNIVPTSGNIVLASGNTYINNVKTPVQDGDAASKYYVDIMASAGIAYHQPVYAATVANSATTTGGTVTYTQPNGASNGVGAYLQTTGSWNLIDTANVQTANTRILIKNEGNAVWNGVYGWANATTIIRTTDTDSYGPDSTTDLSINDYFYTTNGNVNAGTAFVVASPSGTITFGSSNITFSIFSTSQVYSANSSAGLSLNGTVFSAKIDNNTTAFDGNGNIIVKAGANLTTPNIGAATGTSLSATGNIVGGNVNTGALSLTGNVISALNVTGNVAGGNITTPGLISATGAITSSANITGGNINTAGLISAGGNVIGGNISTLGVISALSTITSSANVTGGNLLTGGVVSATGNVTGNYILGNGALLTGVITSVANINLGNSNVTVTSAGGNITVGVGGTANVAVFATTGEYITGVLSASGNVTGGNVLTGGLISAAGNVTAGTGSFFIGNGSQLTGVIATSAGFPITAGTSNIAAASGGNIGITVGGASNVGLFTTAGLLVTGLVSANGNVVGGNLSTAGLITATGNITGGNVLTGGLISATGAITSAANITGGNVLTGGLISATGAITSAANITGGNLLTAGVISSTGNITGGNVTATNYYYANGKAIVNYTAATTPPSSPTAGWQWYNTTTDVLYEYISDGTTPYWVDISSPAFAGGVVANVSISGSMLVNANATYNIGSASQTFANVYAQNYFGNGAALTGLITSVANINNGTSNITVVSSGGNITTNVAGTSNVGVWYNGGLSITGDLTVTGNATLTGNIVADRIQNGTTLIDIQTPSGNANISVGGTSNTAVFSSVALTLGTALLPSANITYDLGSTTQRWRDLYLANSTIYLGNSTISANATAIVMTNPAGGQTVLAGASGASQVTGAVVSASGNVIGGNILTGGIVSATANVYAGNILNSGIMSATGNATVGNVLTGGLISATGNITGGNITTGGSMNITGASQAASYSASGNVTGGNILTGGLISATGAITGAAITGSSLTVSTGTVTLGNIVNANGNAVGNIGSSSNYFNTIFGKATTAQYADLAENYLADEAYVPGTVLDFDGDQEVTLSTRDSSRRVAGVVSTNPAHLMNSTLDGAHVVAVALVGRVPTQVTGKIAKGDLMVSAGNGRARAEANPAIGTVIGKALENFDGGEGTIEIVICMQ